MEQEREEEVEDVPREIPEDEMRDALQDLAIHKTIVQCTLSSVLYPKTVIKTLIQMGYEPFALKPGREYIIFGETKYYYPNLFAYLAMFIRRRNFTIVYTGLDAHLCTHALRWYVYYQFLKFLSVHDPDFGGINVDMSEKEENLTHFQSFRKVLKIRLRIVCARVLTVIVCRPLIVVMTRQIAQIITGDTKYTSVVLALKLIAKEEGLRGLFGGLIPQLIGEVLFLLGSEMTKFIAVRYIFLNNSKDKKASESAKSKSRIFNTINLFACKMFFSGYETCATIMAVSGSGMVIPLLPYPPMFENWMECWDVLKPLKALHRGMFWAFRKQVAPTFLGVDRRVYDLATYSLHL